MSRWFRLYECVLDDPKVQRLPPELFKEAFFSAVRAGDGPLAHFVQLERSRSPAGWSETRQRIFERDDYRCRYCGARGVRLECDHIFPVSRGGGDDDKNLATACFRCNRSKRAKTVGEWLV